jgi:lipopolysaccharide assembly protein A
MAAQTGSMPAPKRGMGAGQYFKFGFIGVLVVLAFVFIFQNTQRVRLEFLWWHFTAQMWIMLLILFVVGTLAGLLLGWRRERRRRRQYR